MPALVFGLKPKLKLDHMNNNKYYFQLNSIDIVQKLLAQGNEEEVRQRIFLFAGNSDSITRKKDCIKKLIKNVVSNRDNKHVRTLMKVRRKTK